ncbi:MAG: pseudouridine synthase [Phycisphaerales bacterium]
MSAPQEVKPGVRLQRVMAAAGVGARRACERLIEEGRVTVNGRVVRSLPVFVNPRTDHIVVEGRPIARERVRRVYVMLNKPARVLGTTSDEPGMERKTVASLVKHPSASRLVVVGRLPFDATGLVLLTNDGPLVNRLTHPSYGIVRRYVATIRGTLDQPGVSRLERELNKLQRVHDRRAGKLERQGGQRVALRLLGGDASKTRLGIEVPEGRTSDIAELLATVGTPTKSLERVAIGPIELTGVARGRWRELERDEVAALRSAVKATRGAPARAGGVVGERAASKRAGTAHAAQMGDRDESAEE